MTQPHISLACLGALAILAAQPLSAAQPATDPKAAVLVVVNDASPVSREIAEYYLRRRAIPPANLCHISAPADETTTREAYASRIAQPIAACLRKGSLAEQILYIVTTSGVPLRIAGKTGVNGDY